MQLVNTKEVPNRQRDAPQRCSEKAASRPGSVCGMASSSHFLILHEVDVTWRFTIQHQFAGFEARNIHRQQLRRRSQSETGTGLPDSVFRQTKRRIGNKINGIRGDLFHAAGRAYPPVINFVTGFFLVGIRPFGIHRRRKRTGTCQACCCSAGQRTRSITRSRRQQLRQWYA